MYLKLFYTHVTPRVRTRGHDCIYGYLSSKWQRARVSKRVSNIYIYRYKERYIFSILLARPQKISSKELRAPLSTAFVWRAAHTTRQQRTQEMCIRPSAHTRLDLQRRVTRYLSFTRGHHSFSYFFIYILYIYTALLYSSCFVSLCLYRTATLSLSLSLCCFHRALPLRKSPV